MIHDSQDMDSNRQNFQDNFLLFCPSNNPEKQNFERLKNLPGDIIILQVCTINNNHIMYGSWKMECHGQNFLSLRTTFYHFTHSPYQPEKSKFWKMKKNPQDIWDILHMCTINEDHIMYDSWDMEQRGQNFL